MKTARHLIILLASITLAACTPRETPVEIGYRKQILHFGNGTEPQDLDPHVVTGVPEHRIISTLFEGLVSFNPKDLSTIPGVAKAWDISEDRTVYTFHLNPEAKWSNGDPVTARDFLFSYQRNLSPALGSEYAYMLHVVKNAAAFNEGKITDFSEVGFNAPDPHTLTITLNAPTPYFLGMLNHFSWFPVHPPTILEHGKMDQRGTRWTKPENFVGNGPFVLERWRLNQIITVTKSNTYWDRDHVRLNEIRFYPIEAENTEERDFRSGRLHVTNTTPIEKIKVYKETDSDRLMIFTLLGTYFYRFNVTKPPLDDVRVRRALSMAIDRKSLVENVTKGEQQPAFHFTPPDTVGYTPEVRIEEDLEEARKLLAEAGFPNGKGFPAVDLLYNTSEGHHKIAQAIQQMWKDSLNIDVKLLNQEWKVYLDTQKNLDYQICRAGWNGDYVDPNNFLDMFITGGGNNDTGWSVPEYDALIAEAALAPTQEKRFELFQKAERILIEASPIMPIYFYTRVYLVQPGVKNWFPNLLDNQNFKFVYLEAPEA